jgi:pimeloyl-ACP methyl ester carboxylesterase
VRFADDFVGCFQFQDAAQNFQRQLRRFARFNLVLGETSSRSQVGSVRALARKRQQQRGSAKTTASRLVSTILYDLWVHQWRQRCATGDVVVVRYADDTIVGFEHRYEAEQFLADLKARFARFGLTLHPDKTRLIEFGRSAIADRRARGLGKPESFDFLGFTHYCATRRSGSGFVLGRKPVAKRMRAKLREIKEQLMAMRHEATERQGRWLCQVLRGWMAYSIFWIGWLPKGSDEFTPVWNRPGTTVLASRVRCTRPVILSASSTRLRFETSCAPSWVGTKPTGSSRMTLSRPGYARVLWMASTACGCTSLRPDFEEEGRPCVLLLHGFRELAFSWRKVMVPLASAGFHVIAPDQRGYGRTSGWDAAYDGDLRSFRLFNVARDTLGLVSALGFRSVAAVVGHDFGSPVAAWCALLRPDVFHSVVLMSAPFPGPPTLPFNTAAGAMDRSAKSVSSGASLHEEACAARSASPSRTRAFPRPGIACPRSPTCGLPRSAPSPPRPQRRSPRSSSACPIGPALGLCGAAGGRVVCGSERPRMHARRFIAGHHVAATGGDAALFIVGLSVALAAALMVMLWRGYSLSPPLTAAMASLAFGSGSGDPAARIPLILAGKTHRRAFRCGGVSAEGQGRADSCTAARMARYSIASSASTEAGASSPSALAV